MEWIRFKDDLTALVGLDRDAMHVYAGLIGIIAAAIITRRTVASFIPWLLVLCVELANEAGDMFADGLVEQWEVDGARHDIWNTMLAASILLVVARVAPGALRALPASTPSEPDPD